jgi:hypothetical protein
MADCGVAWLRERGLGRKEGVAGSCMLVVGTPTKQNAQAASARLSAAA